MALTIEEDNEMEDPGEEEDKCNDAGEKGRKGVAGGAEDAVDGPCEGY